VRSEQLTLSGDPAALAAELRTLIPAPASVQDRVAEIITQVRAAGDEALLEYTRRFDTEGEDPPALAVTEAELDAAVAGLEPSIRAGIERAIENVERVGEAALQEDKVVEFDEHLVILRSAAVQSAGVYVPGGRAPYPSTVVMGVVTAVAAGVSQVFVCAPPRADGELDPVVLGACRLTEAAGVYRMGGAQAIAALAYGTESVAPVDMIVGPGNLWVQEAKRQVSGQVGIDSFAGPSDLLVIADPGSAIEPIVLDLLAQAEHGPGTLVVAASSSTELLEGLAAGLAPAQETGAVCRLVALPAHPSRARQLAQAFAPEHLQLIGPQAEALAPQVSTAGCVFVGANAGTAFGDYIAGSNHILPTGGAGRFASALSARSFRRSFTEVRLTDAADLARTAAPLARAEGFELHAQSMEARIRENQA
jgi:histidinol dehydrogenase